MLQHVTREVPPSKLQDCLSFYELLGLSQVQPPPGIAGRAVWLERAGTQVHLMLKQDAQLQSGHIALVVADYEQTLRRLRERGHQVDPRTEHWGSPRCYVTDPVGNLVELMAWAPAPQS